MGRGKSKTTPKTLFAKRLKVLIGDESFSSFEEKTLLSPGSASRMLRGSEPKLMNLEAIINGTGCNAQWLITGIGEPYPTNEKDD